MSQETFRQTERVFVYEPLAPVEVKGKSEPVGLYRAVEARARFGADLIRTPETLFVGREVEKTLLQGLFDRCARDSTFELVTLVGEPGVGKSRLCAELFGYIDEKTDLIRWRQGRCLPYGEGITFWALGEIVKSHAGVFESDSPEAASAKLERVLPDVEERDWLRARLLPLLGVDSGQSASRDESFPAWRRFVESIASDGPAVVVVEDLHWADAPFLDFLSYLSEWAEGVPLLLLCTARPELFEAHSTWGAGTRNSHTINLSPLSNSETSDLVQGLLEQTVSDPVRAAILERSGGNPLYAEEFVRLVADRGLGESGDGLAFPESVQALIAARLDTLVAGAQSPAAGRSRRRQGVLGRRPRCDERARRARGRARVARALARRSSYARPVRRRWKARANTRSGTSSSERSRTARLRGPRAPGSTVPQRRGSRRRPASGSRISPTSLRITTRRRSTWPEPPATSGSRPSFCPKRDGCSILAGDRAAALDQTTADGFYRRALALCEDARRGAGAVAAQGGANSCRAVGRSQAEQDAGRAVDLYLAAGDELGAAEALLDLTRYAGYQGRNAEAR